MIDKLKKIEHRNPDMLKHNSQRNEREAETRSCEAETQRN